MQKYLGDSIEKWKFMAIAAKQKVFLIIYLKRPDSKTYEKYVKGQIFPSTPSMKTFNERALWNTPYIQDLHYL